MLEVFKKSNKSKFILTFIFNLIRHIAEYGISFSFALFITAPLTVTKIETLLIVLIILFIVYLLAQYGYIYNAEVFYFQLEINVQKLYFEKLLKMDNTKIGSYNTGFISGLINEYAFNVSYLASDIARIIIPLVIGIGSFLFIAFSHSFLLGFISLISFILIITIRFYMNQKKQKLTSSYYVSQSKYKGSLIDFIYNIKTIIKLKSKNFAYDKVKREKDKCIEDKEIETSYKACIQFVFEMLTNGLYIILFLFVLKDLDNGIDVMGYLMFYITVMGKVISNLKDASSAISDVLDYMTSKKKLDEIITNLQDKDIITNFDKVEIRNGIFSYPNNKTKIIIPHFSVERKDKISIIGESGQGKSTLLNLLTGIYELNSGRIVVDNQGIKNSVIDAVYVSQEIEVFNLTIRDNLLLGKDISDDKIIEIFKDAGLYEWYQTLPNGLDELVGEKGIKLSTGQKQRLNIIRGILIDADTYFFDEPTSNLDVESEEKIYQMIDKYLKDKTYIIVTHRQRLTDLCNKHYVFKNHIMKEVE